MDYIIALDDFMINDKICIQLNYNIDFYNTETTIIRDNIIKSLTHIINQYEVKEYGFIFLLDVSKINNKDLEVAKIKTLLTVVTDQFPNMLHKCIVYNYSKTVKMLFNLIKNFLDKVTADKIIIDETISTVIHSVTSDPSIIDQMTTSNS